jgi:hypothetical protein
MFNNLRGNDVTEMRLAWREIAKIGVAFRAFLPRRRPGCIFSRLNGHPAYPLSTLSWVPRGSSARLEETGSGRSRKFCDYLGVAAVAWAKNEFIIMTQYVSRRTSRAAVVTADGSREPVVIDQPLLTKIVPVELRPQLRKTTMCLWKCRESRERHSRFGCGDMGSTMPTAFAGTACMDCPQAAFPARKSPGPDLAALVGCRHHQSLLGHGSRYGTAEMWLPSDRRWTILRSLT